MEMVKVESGRSPVCAPRGPRKRSARLGSPVGAHMTMGDVAMRSARIFCLFVFAHGAVYSQIDSTADVFPLRLGLRLIYGFHYSFSWWGPFYSYTDSGMVEQVIVDSVREDDSTRWTVFQVREYLNTRYNSGWTSSWVRDSIQFEIVEMLSGNHEIFSPEPGFFQPFPLDRVSPDSSKFFRYQRVDSLGRGSRLITTPDGLAYMVTFQKDSGIVQSDFDCADPDDPTMIHCSVHHFRMADSMLLDASDQRSLPRQRALYQNYPNPFNPTTTIRYAVTVPGLVILSVYDILGNLVAILVNQNMNPGIHEVEFDGSGLSSGIYIYRLQSEGKLHMKYFVLMK